VYSRIPNAAIQVPIHGTNGPRLAVVVVVVVVAASGAAGVVVADSCGGGGGGRADSRVALSTAVEEVGSGILFLLGRNNFHK
jgi:hypothetical protein